MRRRFAFILVDEPDDGCIPRNETKIKFNERLLLATHLNPYFSTTAWALAFVDRGNDLTTAAKPKTFCRIGIGSGRAWCLRNA